MSGLLAGDFALEGLLGRGGMGAVHTAVQRSTGRRVAVKVLPQGALDAERIARFDRECAALSRLAHPNIVHVYTHGRDGDGRPFLAMELVEGRTLQTLLAAESPLDIGRAVLLAVQIVEGLAYAHERQIAHRDIKPSNVMVTRVLDRELVKLVDFGLAKLLDDGVEAGTQSGRILGSAPYMSPEQWNQTRDIDGRADLYSFGCVCYELLTGRAPFVASGLVGYLKAHLAGACPEPAQLRPELATHPELLAVLARTMATDRDRRPADARALLAELRPLELRYRAGVAPLPPLVVAPAPELGAAGTAPTRSSGGSIGAGWVSSVATEPAPSVNEPRRVRRRRLLATGGGVLAVGALALVLALVSGHDEVPPSELPPGSAATVPAAVGVPPASAHEDPERSELALAPARSSQTTPGSGTVPDGVDPPAPEVAAAPTPASAATGPERSGLGLTPARSSQTTPGSDAVLDGVSVPPPSDATAPTPVATAATVVHVATRPPGAEVVYDGAARGRTPLDLTLRVGAAPRLVLQRAGYRARRVELDLATAGEQPLVVQLERLRHHAPASAPPPSAPPPETPAPAPPALDLDRLPIE